jgi:hypothetical protein
MSFFVEKDNNVFELNHINGRNSMNKKILRNIEIFIWTKLREKWQWG